MYNVIEVMKMCILLIIISLIKARKGIQDDTVTKAAKVVTIIECSLRIIYTLLKIADKALTTEDIAAAIAYAIILVVALNIKKIQIALLDNHFRGE